MTEQQPLSLKEQVKRDIYDDFREMLNRLDNFEQFPIKPNKQSFLSSFLQFNIIIRIKIQKSIMIDKEKFGTYSEILEYMKNKRSINDLDLNSCKELTFKLSDFLDTIGITQIWSS